MVQLSIPIYHIVIDANYVKNVLILVEGSLRFSNFVLLICLPRNIKIHSFFINQFTYFIRVILLVFCKGEKTLIGSGIKHRRLENRGVFIEYTKLVNVFFNITKGFIGN